MLLLCAMALGAAPSSLPVALHPAFEAGEVAGEARAQQELRRFQAGALGALAGGAAAGAGIALGSVPRVDNPGCAVLGCGTIGLVSAAWGWELASAEVPQQSAPEELQSDAWSLGFEQGYQTEVLAGRRKWGFIGGALSVAAVSAVWWLSSRLWEEVG